MSDQKNISFRDMADVVKIDPGLTARCFMMANLKAGPGKSPHSISNALLHIGFDEIRKIAACKQMVDGLSKLKGKVNWDLFWLHSILTARLTECLVQAYQLHRGKGYLAGLLHDVGKIFMADHFPTEFEYLMMHATQKKIPFYEAEKEITDITHSEIGAELCNKFQIDIEISLAIRHHHEPVALLKDAGAGGAFLPLCVLIGDSLANIREANIQGGSQPTGKNLETSEEWKMLQQFTPKQKLQLDVENELSRAHETLNVIKKKGKQGG